MTGMLIELLAKRIYKERKNTVKHFSAQLK